MSTLGQPNLESSWKQEVNRRLAAHKNRKGGAPASAPQEHPHSPINSVAAAAAARVAARYAKAPSYSQMQAEEARVAVRAAEIATRVALEAQAAAENALAELHAATVAEPSRGPAVVESIERAPRPEAPPEPECALAPEAPVVEEVLPTPAPAEPEPAEAEAVAPPPIFVPAPGEGRNFGVRWDPEMPVHVMEPKPSPPRPQENFELATEDWWTPTEVSTTLHNEPIVVADAQLAHANLIQFPRELVATRKMRPRLAEAMAAAAPEEQLSIFEVDPASVATEAEPFAPEQEAQAPSWSGADWSGMELDAQPAEQAAANSEAESARKKPALAPLGLRLMANVVDVCLMLAVLVLVAYMAAGHLPSPISVKTAEVSGALALMLIGVAYYAFFLTVAACTPGMFYAGLKLCTFSNENPNRGQLQRRLGAMLLSLLPLGLGVVWSVLDEDHLTWHDRFSQTYLRKR